MLLHHFVSDDEWLLWMCQWWTDTVILISTWISYHFNLMMMVIIKTLLLTWDLYIKTPTKGDFVVKLLLCQDAGSKRTHIFTTNIHSWLHSPCFCRCHYDNTHFYCRQAPFLSLSSSPFSSLSFPLHFIHIDCMIPFSFLFLSLFLFLVSFASERNMLFFFPAS